MDYDNSSAKLMLDNGISQAQGLLGDPAGVDRVLIRLEQKLKEVPVVGKTLADLPLMIGMVKAWVWQDYRVVSPKVIACLLGAFLYLIKRRDLIPDSIPVLGLTDDLAVLGLAMKMCGPELQAFAEWRRINRYPDA